MNIEQIKGIIERILTVVVTYLVAKGYVPQALGPEIVTAIIGVITVIYGFYVNRPTALAVATVNAAGPGTTVVAPAAVANATPNASVVSATENKVVAK